MSDPIEYGRARRCVTLAADEAPSARSWLTRDEFGTWERQARELLAKALANPLAASMTVAQVDAEVATMLAWLALEALLLDAKRDMGAIVGRDAWRKKRRRRRLTASE